jgi:pectate lyase
VLRGPVPVLTLLAALAAGAAACGEARAYPYVPRAIGNCPLSIVGYADLAGTDADGGVTPPTNGGLDSVMPPVTVSDVGRLTAELQRPEPRVIFLDGMLAATETIKVTVDRDVPNGNKTLIGVGANSGLTGAGLDLSYSHNIIVRNLKMAKIAAGEGDAITVLGSHHIWIDHCDLSSDPNDTTSGFDGLVDITHGSQYVTVSWTKFHDHKDTSLVGHSSNAMQMEEDSRLSVTYHHNLFLDVNSGPRVRWGTAHVYSNHFQNVASFGVVSESLATVQVDHNLFEAVTVPIATTYQDPTSGAMVESSNSFPAGFTVDIMRPADPLPPPYAYMSDGVESVAAIVAACAGTGKITL